MEAFIVQHGYLGLKNFVYGNSIEKQNGDATTYAPKASDTFE